MKSFGLRFHETISTILTRLSVDKFNGWSYILSLMKITMFAFLVISNSSSFVFNFEVPPFMFIKNNFSLYKLLYSKNSNIFWTVGFRFSRNWFRMSEYTIRLLTIIDEVNEYYSTFQYNNCNWRKFNQKVFKNQTVLKTVMRIIRSQKSERYPLLCEKLMWIHLFVNW